MMATAAALAAGSSGAGAATDLLDATFFQGVGKPAAATDLLDEPISDGMEKLLGSPAIVLGDNGGVSNSFTLGRFLQLLRRIRSTSGVWSLQRVTGMLPVSRGDNGSTAFSLLHHSPIRDCRPNSLHHPIHACAHSRLDKCGVSSGVGLVLGLPAWMALYLMEFVLDLIQ